MSNEHIEKLGSGVSLIVSNDHTFGTDALLLADFAQPRKSEKVCDFGTGCGIIPLLWYRDIKGLDITGIDIQESAISQFVRSVELNKAENKVRPIKADLRNLKGVVEFGSFNLVTMNPPYKPKDTGIVSESKAALIARHEIMCTIDDVTKSASNLLNFGGRLCMCHRPERLSDVIVSMNKVGIEPKKLRLVFQNTTKEPWLFLIEGRKGGKPGMRIMPPLVMKKDDNTNSDELNRILGEYAEGH